MPDKQYLGFPILIRLINLQEHETQVCPVSKTHNAPAGDEEEAIGSDVYRVQS